MECHLAACGTGISQSNRCVGCEARRTGICACLSPGELLSLEAITRAVRFAAKETLFCQGQPAASLYTVTSGVVRLYKLLPDGRRQIVGFALPGDFLGLSMRAVFGVSADAVEAVEACRVPLAAFAELVDARPHLLRRLHDLAVQELALAQEQMLLLGRRTAEEKIICFLLGMQQRWVRAKRFSVTVPLPMSRQDIADFLGLTIETVSRTLNRLARDRTILIVPGGVRLINAERMARVAAA